MINSLLILVKISVHRAAIGLLIYSQILPFYFRSISNYYVIVNILLTLLFVVLILIILANEVELNPGPTSLLNFGHLNVRSLNNQDKFDGLSLIIKDSNFHVFAVSETWLNNNISSENFKDHVKSVLRISSAHNKNNRRDPTIGILIKLEPSLVLFFSFNLIKIPTVGSRQLCLL